TDLAVRSRILEDHTRLPLAFEENRGQAGSTVRYLTRGQGYGLLLTPGEAVLALRAQGRQVRTLRLRWVDANPGAPMVGEDRLAAKTHSLRGSDPARWLHTPLFSKVRSSGVYPGIDLVFYGRERQLEYDFVLAPGADPDVIRLAVEGAERLEIGSEGDLIVALGDGEVRFRRPVSYQEVDGVRREVTSRYRLQPSGEGFERRVGFEVGAYDVTRPLVIDPVLVYSTYLGGREEDGAQDIAMDAAGNVYVTGYTISFPDPPNDFPVTPGAFQSEGSWFDTFVTKLDPSGALVYSTLLGGEAEDGASGIVVDTAGNAYVAGTTASPDFPLVNPLQPGPKDYAPDAFVAKLNADGSALLFSTTLGGTFGEFGDDIGMDAQGALYVIGHTGSADFPLPGFPPLPATHRPFTEVFVVKLAPGGSALLYTRTFGGPVHQLPSSLAVDPAGQAHVTGFVDSAGFPVVNAAQPAFGGDRDAFALKLDAAGSLVYSTYLGGSGSDAGYAIALDPAGNAYVTGETLSDNFPVASALQPVRRGSRDIFVTKLSPTGSLAYSTYLGGTHDDQALDIAADPAGNVFLTGATTSEDYPVANPLQAGCAPNPPTLVLRISDAFVTQLSAGGSSILFSTCFGGSSSDGGYAVALHPSGDIFVAGVTYSTDFPVLSAFQPTYGGGGDAFVTRIRLSRPPECGAASSQPAVLWPPSGRFVPVTIAGVADPDGGPVAVTFTGIRQDEPPTGRQPDASGVGAATAQVNAERSGKGDGRVYHLSFMARDEDGLSCSGTVTVCVPHDQRGGAKCGDGGPLFDSAAAGR
ncbi:MAG TPA: SBBP repeat-containing protein, partial [Thermoanaerobaculia bacterium]